jgi:capsid portal protein
MSVTLEYSYNINKDGSEKRHTLYDLADHFGGKCDTQYEFEGGRQIKRSHCIIIITFDEENESAVNHFISNANNLSRVYLECIYDSNNEIIYSSKYFRKCKQTK